MARFIFSNINSFIITGILSAILFLKYLCPTVRTGYWCHDRLLQAKYNGDTFTTKMLWRTAFSPVIFIMLGEVIILKLKDYAEDIEKTARRSLHYLKSYGLGWFVNVTVVEILKNLIGEKRPHFFDTCRPTGAETCRPGQFIKDYECTITDHESLSMKENWKSFPSGHAAMATYVCIFMIWYIRKRFENTQKSTGWVQFVFACWALFCSITRVTDARHFWWDVIAGNALAISISIFVCKYLCNNFAGKPKTTKIS